MRFRSEFLKRYLRIAPAALAVERSLECEILAQQTFERPILDIGCGDGVFAAVLFADKVDVGIDYDPQEIDRARQYDRYEELIICGGDSVPKPDGYFRTIFANSVLEHIPDLMPVLREAHRLLTPGGRFYVTIPTDRWERTVLPARLLAGVGLVGAAEHYGRWYNSFWRHHHAYTTRRWSEIFAEAGFTVADQMLYSPANVTTFLDALTPIAAPAMVTKKLQGRWILNSAFRNAVAELLYPILKRSVAALGKQDGGGLVFVTLTK